MQLEPSRKLSYNRWLKRDSHATVKPLKGQMYTAMFFFVALEILFRSYVIDRWLRMQARKEINSGAVSNFFPFSCSFFR